MIKPNPTLTLAEWQEYARVLHARADRCCAMIVARARKDARAAGLDPSIAFLHAHNAIVSRDCGHPWPEVDYSLARRVIWLGRKSWEPGRIAARVISRAFLRDPWADINEAALLGESEE